VLLSKRGSPAVTSSVLVQLVNQTQKVIGWDEAKVYGKKLWQIRQRWLDIAICRSHRGVARDMLWEFAMKLLVFLYIFRLL